jgi:small subunit ribosomal protein S9
VAKTKVIEFIATGRRKTAVARVRLVHGVGKRQVNGKNLDAYFHQPALLKYVEQPLEEAQAAKGYDVIARLHGGGIVGQAGALRHGIARALVLADENQRQTMKDGGFLTRDARMKERKKPGQPGARKRFQFSKR